MLNLVKEGEEDYIEAIRYRRRLKIFENSLFFSFSTSVVGTSGFAPSATSGPLILPVLGTFEQSCSLISATLNLRDDFLASI